MLKKKKITAILSIIMVCLMLSMSVIPVYASSSPNTDYSKYSEPSSSDYAYWNGSKTVKAKCTTANEIRYIQAALNKLISVGVFKSSYLAVDGSYGPASKAAVASFQSSQGITVDGKCGPLTIAALKNALKKIEQENNQNNLLWPTKSTSITGKYGEDGSKRSNGTRYHSGIDIGSSIGDPCYAVADGVVVMCKNKDDDKNTIGGRGRYIVIYHSNGDFSSLYEHLDTVNVKLGDTVKQGDIIGKTGNSGWQAKNKHYAAHLHFGLIEGKMTNTGHDLWTVPGKKCNGKTYVNHTFNPDPRYNSNITYTYK